MLQVVVVQISYVAWIEAHVAHAGAKYVLGDLECALLDPTGMVPRPAGVNSPAARVGDR